MDDTAKRIHQAIVISVEEAINEHVEATAQFQVEEGLGTIPSSEFGLVRGMQQNEPIFAVVEAAVTDAVRGLPRATYDETPEPPGGS